MTTENELKTTTEKKPRSKGRPRGAKNQIAVNTKLADVRKMTPADQMRAAWSKAITMKQLQAIFSNLMKLAEAGDVDAARLLSPVLMDPQLQWNEVDLDQFDLKTVSGCQDAAIYLVRLLSKNQIKQDQFKILFKSTLEIAQNINAVELEERLAEIESVVGHNGGPKLY